MAAALSSTITPLRRYKGEIDYRSIASLTRKALTSARQSQHWGGMMRILNRDLAAGKGTLSFSIVEPGVVGFPESEPAVIPHDALARLVSLLVPWRTGPYDLPNLHIDSEWRSYLKWDRIDSLLPSAEGLRIADVGCSNGYFMFRLMERNPEIAIGFDPVVRCWLQYSLLHHFVASSRMAFIPAGLDSLVHLTGFFDVVVCMGVIYHQRDPRQALATLRNALKPGGTLLLESLTVPGGADYALIPQGRYAKMRNTWFMPSAPHLGLLLTECGFEDVSVHEFGPLSTSEQRRTPFAPYESLSDFLDPNDPKRTIEGYPAPHLGAALGRKPAA